MTAEEAIEKYPGLWEAFKEWYLKTSIEHGENDAVREETEILWYWNAHFMRGDWRMYFGGSLQDLVPIPPHLIAIRDMSLV